MARENWHRFAAPRAAGSVAKVGHMHYGTLKEP